MAIINQMLINGQWCAASRGQTFPVCDPRDQHEIARVPMAGAEDVEAAVDAAHKAFPAWSQANPFERGRLLRLASEKVLENSDRIGRLMSSEQGKPAREAIGEVVKGAEILRYYAEEGERIYGRIIANSDPDTESRVIYQPVGVAAAISPWNYPIELLAWKVGAALAAGCTIVCKLPSETPLSPLAFLDCMVDAGIPDGCINAITGSGSTVGPLLAGNPKVRKVAFTGSTAVGRQVLSYCTENLAKTSMELGGSLPMLIFDDCNLNEAVKGAVRRSFRNMGQICIAVNRIYVQQGIYKNFMERFVEATLKLTWGEGMAKDADLGPMCTAKGVQAVQRHVDDAVSRGAVLRCGGKAPVVPGYENGNWYEPTILSDVDHTMLIMREETFGPAVGVMPFTTPTEAIELANDTPYGLAAIVYTQNLTTVDACTRRIEAGNIAVNNPDAGVINAPYGGMKASGFGKEHGPEALYEYLVAKHVRIRILPD